MNGERYQLILHVRHELSVMKPDERVKFIEALTVGYCHACGERTNVNGICHCQNDE
jgi:hypothetical protein